jgi:hypothetical protein
MYEPHWGRFLSHSHRLTSDNGHYVTHSASVGRHEDHNVDLWRQQAPRVRHESVTQLDGRASSELESTAPLTTLGAMCCQGNSWPQTDPCVVKGEPERSQN